MIIEFKIFEKITEIDPPITNIGNNFKDWMEGAYIPSYMFIEEIPNIIQFLRGNDIEYRILVDFKNDHFLILFPNLKNNDEEIAKFPEDEWNEDKPYLPSSSSDTEDGHSFEIMQIYKDYLTDCKEIKINNKEDLEDLEMQLTANKYNL